ncbi:Protein NRT1/ PTR FAMILY 1.2 [Linum perenne]
MFSELRPSVNDSYEEKVWKLLLLFSAFAIMSIGTGAIRSCSPTFGADQISNPNNRRTIEGPSDKLEFAEQCWGSAHGGMEKKIVTDARI